MGTGPEPMHADAPGRRLLRGVCPRIWPPSVRPMDNWGYYHMRVGEFALTVGLALATSSVATQAALPENPDASPTNARRVAVPEPIGLIALAPAEPATSGPGGQQPEGVLTLAQIEQMAVRCNPSLAQAAARVEAARGQCVQVGLYPNPVAGYVGSEIGNEGRAGQQGGFISQELVTAGKLQLNREVACQEVRQAEWAWQSQRLRVLTDVRRTFYEVLVAQRTVELTEQLVRIGEQGVQSTEELLKAKEVARNDVLQAKIEADSARVLLERARNRYLSAWRNLAAVMGACDMPPRPLAGSVQDGMGQLTWEEALRRLWTQSPQLAAARAGVARAHAVLSRECAGRVPNLDMQTSVQHDNASGYTFASVQVGAPVPVFNRNQGNIRRAQAELMAAQHDVKRTELELQQRLAVAFEQYTNARYQTEKYSKDILPNAQASLKLTTAGFQQGEFSYLSLLTAQRTFFQTNLAYLEALRELRAAGAIIEGNLLSDSLRPEESGRSEQTQLDSRGP
jgi:outer membrane protein, heavy metal efflux system